MYELVSYTEDKNQHHQDETDVSKLHPWKEWFNMKKEKDHWLSLAAYDSLATENLYTVPCLTSNPRCTVFKIYCFIFNLEMVLKVQYVWDGMQGSKK